MIYLRMPAREGLRFTTGHYLFGFCIYLEPSNGVRGVWFPRLGYLLNLW